MGGIGREKTKTLFHIFYNLIKVHLGLAYLHEKWCWSSISCGRCYCIFGGRASHCVWLCYSLQDLTPELCMVNADSKLEHFKNKKYLPLPNISIPSWEFLVDSSLLRAQPLLFFFTSASPKLSTMKAHSANIYWIDSYNVWKFDYSNLLSFPINITVFLICLGSPFLFFIVKVTQTSNSIS